jgi:hypothetical protein
LREGFCCGGVVGANMMGMSAISSAAAAFPLVRVSLLRGGGEF